MPDVAGELGDEEEALSLPRTGGCGVGLCDGAGERLVIRIDYHLPTFDEVLELPEGGGASLELLVEGGVPGVGAGKATAEEGEQLDGVDGGHRRLRCRRRQW